MAYTLHPTVVTGQTWTAANQNTYVKDNLAALWVFTTQGDLIYATSASVAARLAIGGAGAILRSTGTAPAWLAIGAANSILTSSGSAPQWSAGGASKGMVHAMGFDATLSEVTTTSETGVDITGLTLNLTTTVTCTILLWIQGSIAVTGGSAIFTAGVLGHIGGVAQTKDNSIPRSYYAQYEPYANFFRRTGVAAGTITCKAQLFIDDSARTAHFLGGSIHAMAIVE